EFAAELRRFYKTEVTKGVVVAVVGVISGILLIARRRTGRILAISVCSLLFVLWLNGIIHFAIKASFSPIMIFKLLTLSGGIQEQVVNPMFFLLTIFFLTRKSVGVHLKKVVD